MRGHLLCVVGLGLLPWAMACDGEEASGQSDSSTAASSGGAAQASGGSASGGSAAGGSAAGGNGAGSQAACRACAMSQFTGSGPCLSKLTACKAEPTCTTWADCLLACTNADYTESCYAGCGQPSGQAASDLKSCMCDACSDVCGLACGD